MASSTYLAESVVADKPRRAAAPWPEHRSRGYFVRTDTETWAALCATTSTRSTLHMTMELSG